MGTITDIVFAIFIAIQFFWILRLQSRISKNEKKEISVAAKKISDPRYLDEENFDYEMTNEYEIMIRQNYYVEGAGIIEIKGYITNELLNDNYAFLKDTAKVYSYSNQDTRFSYISSNICYCFIDEPGKLFYKSEKLFRKASKLITSKKKKSDVIVKGNMIDENLIDQKEIEILRKTRREIDEIIGKGE